MSDSSKSIATGASLALEASTAELGEAFSERAIEALLLRGPPSTEWLYGKSVLRISLDVDLLVDPRKYGLAEECLRELGFARSASTTPGAASDHAELWQRGSATNIDLHWSVVGATAPTRVIWDALRPWSDPDRTHGSLLLPRPPVRAALTVLHAAQHGAANGRTLRDLECALARASAEDWAGAWRIVQTIGAQEMFGCGLRLSTEGARIATRLRVSRSMSARTALRISGRATTPTAVGFALLTETSGIAARIRLLRYKVVPPVAFMRDWRPLARRGRVGLALAYLYRPLWLICWAPLGYIAWRRAEGAARRTAWPRSEI
jgi:Uncharacterised nucleotidyltransferase